MIIHVSRRAMASEFEVCFPAGSCPDGHQLALDALDGVEQLEERLSVFRPESDICRINRSASESPVAVEPWLFELFQEAMRLYEATGGALDITATPLWEAWGFARRAGRVPSDAELAEARQKVGSQFLELDPDRRTIRFLKPGMKINLGALGKGYALDRCAERLLASGMAHFLLHGGQSSVLARGDKDGGMKTDGGRQDAMTGGERPMVSEAQPANTPISPIGNRKSEIGNPKSPFAPIAHSFSSSSGWQVGVRHPLRLGLRLGVLRLRDRGLGTSSGQFQSFRHQGRRYGHILDPRTGRPADGVFSATVVAPTAAEADALSTAFYVLGPSAAMNFCRDHPDIGLVLFCPESPDCPQGPLRLLVAGLDERDFVKELQ